MPLLAAEQEISGIRVIGDSRAVAKWYTKGTFKRSEAQGILD